MSGIFEHLFMDDSQQRVAGRQAAAVAVKRAKDHFAVFLARSSSIAEREARLQLIDDDLMQIVSSVAAEYDADPLRLDQIVRDALTGRDRIAKFVEARRPKMCPYHREVMDISLASGEPTAGFSAMAQHAWGSNHCQGEFDGSCNFRREMVTQDYWDKKAEEAAERAQQRQQVDIQDGVGDALPDTIEQPEDPEPEVPFEEPIVEEGPEDFAPDFSMAASTKMSEALKTVNVTKGGETPIPKMDKRKWTPENVAPLDTEGSGSPHPTRHQDITDKPDWRDIREDTGHFDQTDAVLESQDVTQGSETKAVPSPASGGSSWSGNGGQADPVTSAALDVDKNPLREILENDFGGFVPSNVVQQAVARHQRKEAYGMDDYDPMDSGGYRADPMGHPGQPEWDDPNGPYYDEPCPACGARQGAYEGGHCMACGHQEAPGGQQAPGGHPIDQHVDMPPPPSHMAAGYGSPEHDVAFGNNGPFDGPGYHDSPADGPAQGCQACGNSLGPMDMTCPTCGAPAWEGDPNHGVPSQGPYDDGSITPGSGRHWSDPNPGSL